MADARSPLGLATDATVLPRYAGQSLLNVPASVCAALEAPLDGLAPPLDPAVLPPALLDGVRAVVLLVVDGLGRWQLDAALAEGQAPTLARLAARASAGDELVSLATITSIFPSSTMPALTTLNTGLPPAAHGLIGWTVFLEEFGEAAEIARWGPAAGLGSYLEPGLGGHDPVAFFGTQTLHQRLAEAGVRPLVFGRATHRRSGFSQMVFQGADYRGYVTTSSLFPMAEQLLAQRTEEQRLYLYCYWAEVDTLAHLRGPRTTEHREELAVLDFVLGRWIERQEAHGDLLFLLTADHGHVPTPPERVVRLDLEPELVGLLRSPPTGERRMAYLHPQPGCEPALRTWCEQRLSEFATPLEPAEAFASGLFGPGAISAATHRRAGELLLLARDDVQLVWPLSESHPARPFHGNHGALAPEEMLVPLLALRL